jgi:hypothetical protein
MYNISGSQSYRDNLYQSMTKFAIMAKSEVMTDIPEQRKWPKKFDKRYRGMSAVLGSADNHPTTGAEENLICGCMAEDPQFWGEVFFPS